jgi:hypothetical protein
MSARKKYVEIPKKIRYIFLHTSWPLWLCLLLALGIRGWLIIHTHGIIDGDEALEGIQAQHILQGERPIYYYGQAYMGSLEAYLVALSSFLTGGLSAWSLHLVTALVSLLLVYLTWICAAALADSVHLALPQKRIFMLIATLISVLPPLYDMVVELRALGGYIESFVLMLWLLYSTLRLTQIWQAPRSRREIVWRYAGIGFLIGLGLWVDPITIYAILTVVLWIGGCLFKEWLRAQTQESYFSFRDQLPPMLAAIPAGLLGFAPGLYWGATHQWENIAYMLINSNSTALTLSERLSGVSIVSGVYLACMAPRVLGGALSTQPDVTTANPHVLTIDLFITLACLGVIISSNISEQPLLRALRRFTALPLLFMISTTLIFISSTVMLHTATCALPDQSGRYLTPLVIALPFLLAAIFTALLTGQQIQPAEQAAPRPLHRNWLARVLWSYRHLSPGWRRVNNMLALLLLVTYFGSQWVTYLQSDPNETFQSTYCTAAPADDSAIIAYMEQAHIRYAWGLDWLTNPLMYESHGKVFAAETEGRIPEDTAIILHSDRPSLLGFAPHNDPDPLLLRLLTASGVTYHVKRFPGQQGYDILLITPLDKTVSPADPAFTRVFTVLEATVCRHGG